MRARCYRTVSKFLSAGVTGSSHIKIIRRTHQEANGAEAGEHGHSEECSWLPSRKGLRPPHEIVKVADPDAVGYPFDL
jgi:hypothetical protein